MSMKLARNYLEIGVFWSFCRWMKIAGADGIYYDVELAQGEANEH